MLSRRRFGWRRLWRRWRFGFTHARRFRQWPTFGVGGFKIAGHADRDRLDAARSWRPHRGDIVWRRTHQRGRRRQAHSLAAGARQRRDFDALSLAPAETAGQAKINALAQPRRHQVVVIKPFARHREEERLRRLAWGPCVGILHLHRQCALPVEHHRRLHGHAPARKERLER
jgi:hypothetical protein